ncbi:hypothetical protein [Lysinibacillus fusiformis]|uniref:hypothetical protein n=1 Tax=Lysinibacillus fusiformis TaxID=28031 RepID=UPI003CF97CF8
MDRMWAIIIVFVVIIIIFTLLSIYDKNKVYGNIPINMNTYLNGDFYFFIRVFVWEKNKMTQVLNQYKQNTYLDFDGYIYKITHGGSIFNVKDSFNLEKEIRFFGVPIPLLETININNITINQFGDGMITIDLSSNEIINLENYISQDTTIDLKDKRELELFLNKLKQNQPVEQSEVTNIYSLFLKYEPLASFGLNLFTCIKELFK